jgi:hypothetical protein
MSKKKVQRFIIECTLDPEYNHWELWDGKSYLSYGAVKDDVWKLTQREAEYNRTEAAQDIHVRKVVGFRIVQEYIETTTEIITEFLI